MTDIFQGTNEEKRESNITEILQSENVKMVGWQALMSCEGKNFEDEALIGFIWQIREDVDAKLTLQTLKGILIKPLSQLDAVRKLRTRITVSPTEDVDLASKS